MPKLQPGTPPPVRGAPKPPFEPMSVAEAVLAANKPLLAEATPSEHIEPPFDPEPPQPNQAESLAQRLVRASEEVGPRLHKASEHLNGAIFAVQVAFGELRLGVSASVEFGEQEPEGRFVTYLSYRKHEGNWVFVVEVIDEATSERVSVTPLVKASRERRLEAVRRLPDLADQLIESATQQCDEVDDEVISLGALVEGLNKLKRQSKGPKS